MKKRPQTVRAALEEATGKAAADQKRLQASVRAYSMAKERQRQEAAAQEVVSFARRLTPADLQTINALHARGGWPAVAQALHGAGLGADALAVAGAVANQGGLPALGQVVSERIQAEDSAHLQATATQELVGFARRLTPEQVALVEQIHTQRGWAAVDAELAASGLSEAARLVALRTVEQGGLQGLGRAIQEHTQHEDTKAAAEQATKATVEEWTPAEGDSARLRAAKDTSIAKLLRDPGFHTAAAGMARELTARGLTKPGGRSDAQWVVEMLHTLDGGGVLDSQRKPFDPRVPEDQRLAAVSDLLGGASPAATQKFLDQFETARAEHRLIDRMAAHDEKRPTVPAKAPASGGLRSTIEKAAAKHGADKEPPIAVGNGLQATIAVSAGREVDLSTHARRDVQRMIDGYTPKPDDSLRGAIERAVVQEGERDETSTTEGGTNE